MNENDLWLDVEWQLDRQRKPSDVTWVNFLNRMFVERCREAGIAPLPHLARENCSISSERWAPADLMREAVLHHERALPKSADRPIFVRYMGKLLLIDGNNRVIQWGHGRGVVTCEIIVLEYPRHAGHAPGARIDSKGDAGQ